MARNKKRKSAPKKNDHRTPLERHRREGSKLVPPLAALPNLQFAVGGYNYMWLHKRSQGKSLLGFRMAPSLQDEAAGLLDAHSITYIRKPKKFLVTVDEQMIEQNDKAFIAIAELVKKSWEAGG